MSAVRMLLLLAPLALAACSSPPPAEPSLEERATVGPLSLSEVEVVFRELEAQVRDTTDAEVLELLPKARAGDRFAVQLESVWVHQVPGRFQFD